MDQFQTFNFPSTSRFTFLINSEKNYKIFRERIKHLERSSPKMINVLINGKEKHNQNIAGWIKNDGLRVNLFFSTIKVRNHGISKYLNKKIYLANTMRFGVRLKAHYPSGHNKETALLNSRFIRYLNFSRVLGAILLFRNSVITHRLTKLELDPNTERILEESDFVFFSFPVQQSNSVWQCELVRWCRNKKIRTVHLVASWDNLTNRVPSPYGRLDQIVVWAPWQGKQAVDLWNYDARDVYLLNPRILLPKIFSAEELAVKKTKNLKSDLRIGYLGSSTGVINPESEFKLIEKLIDQLLNFINVEKLAHITLSVRVHPLVVSRKLAIQPDYLKTSAKLECLISEPEGESGTIFKDEDISELSEFIASSDVIVGINTSTMIEARAGGAEVVAMPSKECDNFVNHNFHFKQVQIADLFCIPSTFEEFLFRLTEIVNRENSKEHQVFNARKFLGSN